MEMKLGEGSVLITTTARENELGLLLQQTTEPHDVGDYGPVTGDPNYMPSESDIIIWTRSLESALVLKDQVDRLCRSLAQRSGANCGPTTIPSVEACPNGMHQRYHITKLHGRTDPAAEYFVLRLDEGGSDPKHVAACRKAALVYADEIADHLPELAADIRRRYKN